MLMPSRETDDSVQVLVDQVLSEIRKVLSSVSDDSVWQFIGAILQANRIVVHGAGRMGIVSAAFAMRLAQLGFRSHLLSEPTTPGVGEGDLLVLGSGSGETQTVHEVAVLARQHGVRIALITARPDSRIGRLAEVVVPLSTPTKLTTTAQPLSVQPMTTVAEQSLMVFFDVVVLLLMQVTGQATEDLWRRHRNLE